MTHEPSRSPIAASDVKVGSCCILNKRPCKIVSVTHAKTGKHGHMKCVLVGMGMLDGKKEQIVPAGHQKVMQFQSIKSDMLLLDINIDDKSLSCLNSANQEVTVGMTYIDESVSRSLLKSFAEGKSLSITVVKVPIQLRGEDYTDAERIESFKIAA